MIIQTVSQVTSDNVPTEFKDFDLRFFSHIEIGDTYNGQPNPQNGLRYYAILYGKTAIYEYHRYYHDGRGQRSNSTGNKSAPAMFDAAKLYLQIVEIARAKYFRTLDEEKVSTADPSWDVVTDGETLALLQTHPQYEQAVKDFAIALEPDKQLHEKDRRIRVWRKATT